MLDLAGLVTVQDAGRGGLAHLGVPRSGWLDPPAARLASRLVGNLESTALLEVSAGGLAVRLQGPGRWVAVSGASAPLTIAGRPRGLGRSEWLAPGATLVLAAPRVGVRSYLAIGGGVAVEPVLGSRSSDTLGGVGPPVVARRQLLPLGPVTRPPAPYDVPLGAHGLRRPGPLRLTPGPQAHWFAPAGWIGLTGTRYCVSSDSNRVGLRLDGPPLTRSAAHDGREVAVQGLVLGAVQVPPSGRPVVFLADHPTTGGYPVVAVLDPDDVAACAQLRPGDQVRFAPSPTPSRGARAIAGRPRRAAGPAGQ